MQKTLLLLLILLFNLGIAQKIKNEGKIKDKFESMQPQDSSINEYKNFADAKYYKALSLTKIGKNADAKALFLESKSDFKNGFTFNEGNSIYEQFPYQVSQFTYINGKIFPHKKIINQMLKKTPFYK